MTERKFTADQIRFVTVWPNYVQDGEQKVGSDVCECTPAQREAVAEALNQPEWVEEFGRAKEAWPALCDILLGADNPGEVVDGINMFSEATGWGKPKLLCD